MRKLCCIIIAILSIAGCARNSSCEKSNSHEIISSPDYDMLFALQSARGQDRDPILRITVYPSGAEIYLTDRILFGINEDDIQYLIIETGEVRGMLDGGGYIYCSCAGF